LLSRLALQYKVKTRSARHWIEAAGLLIPKCFHAHTPAMLLALCQAIARAVQAGQEFRAACDAHHAPTALVRFWMQQHQVRCPRKAMVFTQAAGRPRRVDTPAAQPQPKPKRPVASLALALAAYDAGHSLELAAAHGGTPVTTLTQALRQRHETRQQTAFRYPDSFEDLCQKGRAA